MLTKTIVLKSCNIKKHWRIAEQTNPHNHNQKAVNKEIYEK